MDQVYFTFWLSIFGTAVSTVLACVRGYEFFRDRRPKLSLISRLCSWDELGNDLVLLNSSKIPANIYYYELVWAKRSFLGKNIKLGRRILSKHSPLEEDLCDITVPPHQQATLNFSEQNHFGTISEHDLYLRLSLVGRRSPLWLWVLGRNKPRLEPRPIEDILFS
jgi:hypothetical protein